MPRLYQQRSCLLVIAATILLFSCKLANKEKPEVDNGAAATAAPTPPPSWIQQSNVYEINVRQYTPEGTFNAFAQHLPRLKKMGVEILWFMPITPISKTDRKGTLGSYYAVADYRGVNPEFGTLEDFKALVKKAHEMGFKVITDWVPNHTGADHPWLKSNPDFFVKDSLGNAAHPYDWTDTRDLNYDNMAMRDSMIDAMKYWIRETDIDGFRCDVAWGVPVDFWKKCIPELRAMKSIFMLAEGDAGDLHQAGFDASYPWEMFQMMKKVASGERNALSLDTVLKHQDSTFPAGAIRLYFTSNHDENSWNKSDYGTFPGTEHAPFAVFTQTMRASLPLVYSGQEEPVLRKIEFFEKDPMKFGSYKREKFYSTLLHLRENNPALAVEASFKRVKVGDDKALYAYVREKAGHKVFVILNFSDKEQRITIPDNSFEGEPYNVFLATKEKLSSGHSFNIEPWGYIIYDYDR